MRLSVNRGRVTATYFFEVQNKGVEIEEGLQSVFALFEFQCGSTCVAALCESLFKHDQPCFCLLGGAFAPRLLAVALKDLCVEIELEYFSPRV